jgi:regulator of chromosome condensation
MIGHLKNIVDIGAGSDHSFAIDKNNNVYSWGLNSFGQTGIADNAGESEAVTAVPTLIKSLTAYGKIIQITGGNHHSIAVTDNGDCLVWGRLDCYATGLKLDSLHSTDVIRDLNNKPRILTVPTPVPGLTQRAFATAGSDHTIAISKDFKAFSWGFNVDRQTGQKTEDDIECATLISHPAINEQKLVWAGAGGQYSVLATKA